MATISANNPSFILQSFDFKALDKLDNITQILSKLNVFSKQYEIHSIKYYENKNIQQQNDNNKICQGYFVIVEKKRCNGDEKHKEESICLKIRKLTIYQKIKDQNQAQLKNQIEFNENLIESNLQMSQQSFEKRFSNLNFNPTDPTVAYLLLTNQLDLYFLTTKSKQAIKIILSSEYPLSGNIQSYFSFQSTTLAQKEAEGQQRTISAFSLYLEGYHDTLHKNVIIIIQLNTFEIKQFFGFDQANKQKNKNNKVTYGPKSTKNAFRSFHDDRLYVFGDHIQQKIKQSNENQQQLLWSFDLQKCYWFALQMKYKHFNIDFNHAKTIIYDSGKVILQILNKMYLLQLYQCRISQLQVIGNQNIAKYSKMFCYNKKILFYSPNSLSQCYYTLKKIKIGQKRENNTNVK